MTKTKQADEGIAADRLRSIVDRIERLDAEKKAISDDVADLYKESQSAGFDVKALRALIAERRKDAAEVAETQTLMDVYRRALGDFVTSPLGAAAVMLAEKIRSGEVTLALGEAH